MNDDDVIEIHAELARRTEAHTLKADDRGPRVVRGLRAQGKGERCRSEAADGKA